ncbi:MAG: hypothetical protein ACREDW_11270 [Aestuariivirgaceae bacterium]
MNDENAAIQNMTESQQAVWRPSLSETPRTLRIVPISGADALEWTMVAVRCVSEGYPPGFSEGVEHGMRMIKDELLLPVGHDLPVREIIGCFSMATANRRATKLSRILHLVHTYPGAPPLHKGLRFVTASLWSGYAALGLEGDEGKLQSARIDAAGKSVWAALGWNVAFD